jgi:ATP-dependent helicase HrpB
VLLLQPRRVAARAIARRIAAERGWTVGREVGWHVRFDRREAPDTALVVITEGILTARLQQDPLLSGVRTVIIDEFHERSIHADLGLALARQAWIARDDLRLVVMSATLDADAVAAFLGGCPIVDVPGRTFPLDIEYRPDRTVEQAIVDELRAPAAGRHDATLCFLPGAPEIRRAADAVAAAARDAGVLVCPLHGGLDSDAQDAAIKPAGQRRVVLATNIAETTLTVPDVTRVIDSGWHKVARYDADRGIDSLELERISQAAADQRAGRAGRTRPGVVVRLWDGRDRLRPHREPDIARVDLAGPALEVLAWGGDPRTLAWFEAPEAGALDAALDLLRRLGALDSATRVTPIGRDMQRLPLPPRLARLVVAAGGSAASAAASALLSERRLVPPRREATPCDLLAALDRQSEWPAHLRQVAEEIERVARSILGQAAARPHDERRFRQAVLTAYPDRVGRRRAPNGDAVLLASGAGARLGRESGVVNAEYLVAVDLTAGTAGGSGALIRIATGIEREWLEATSRSIAHRLDEHGVVRAVSNERYGDVILASRPCAPDPVEAGAIVADAYRRRGPSEADMQLLRRLAFAGVPASFDALVHSAVATAVRLSDVDLAAHVPYADRVRLDRDAPRVLRVPSGRDVLLEYREHAVVAAVKLQELFGLADTPRLGPGREPVTFELLSPGGRPVQITRDLRSFWSRGYPEVRKELRARYPKHPWPEDPWTATPTRRAKPRRASD